MNHPLFVADARRVPSALLESTLPVAIATVSSNESSVPAPHFPCFFHTAKCVRYAYLDGVDLETGVDYAHRRLWLTEHLALLLRVFCIDVVGFKILPDRYHVILSPKEKEAQVLSRHEVIVRWRQLYKGPAAMDNYMAGNGLSREERNTVATTAELWRRHLTNTGRLLGHLHQSMALKANQEDGCKGRFWEGRSACKTIVSKASLDALLTELDTAV